MKCRNCNIYKEIVSSLFFFRQLHAAGIGAADMILASGVTVQLTCTGQGLPTWYVNGIFAEGTQLDFSEAGRELTAATLTISGNHTSDIYIYCVVVVRESQLLYQHNISITFQGLLQTSFRICAVNIDMNQLLR